MNISLTLIGTLKNDPNISTFLRHCCETNILHSETSALIVQDLQI